MKWVLDNGYSLIILYIMVFVVNRFYFWFENNVEEMGDEEVYIIFFELWILLDFGVLFVL